MKKWLSAAIFSMSLSWSSSLQADQVYANWMNGKLWGTSQVCGPNAVEGDVEEFQAWLDSWHGEAEEQLEFMNASQYTSPPRGRVCNFASTQDPLHWKVYDEYGYTRFAINECLQDGFVHPSFVELSARGNYESSGEPGFVMRQIDAEIEFYLCDEAQVERAPIKPERLKLFPIDEGLQDGEFASFRQELVEAINQSDRAKIRESFTDESLLSFGEEEIGFVYVDELLKDQQRLEELKWVLLYGGYWTKFNERGTGMEFKAPFFNDETAYAFGAHSWPGLVGEIEPRAHFVTVNNLNLRSEPSLESDVVALVGFELVMVLDKDYLDFKATDFVQVELSDGQRGYVPMGYLRSMGEYRALFERDKINGEWKISAFFSGA